MLQVRTLRKWPHFPVLISITAEISIRLLKVICFRWKGETLCFPGRRIYDIFTSYLRPWYLKLYNDRFSYEKKKVWNVIICVCKWTEPQQFVVKVYFRAVLCAPLPLGWWCTPQSEPALLRRTVGPRPTVPPSAPEPSENTRARTSAHRHGREEHTDSRETRRRFNHIQEWQVCGGRCCYLLPQVPLVGRQVTGTDLRPRLPRAP